MSDAGFDDLLVRQSPKSNSSSPVAGRTGFFTEELSNPFADLQSSTVRFEPPSPTILSGVSPGLPRRQPSLEPAEPSAPSLPLASPTASPTQSLRSPSLIDPSPTRSHGRLDTQPIPAVDEDAPHDRVVVSPSGSQFRGDVPPSPTRMNGGGHGEEVLESLSISGPTSAVLRNGDDSIVESVQGDSESIRTVAMESDRASVHTVQSTSTIPIPLYDAAAKQGILVSVGDPQKMGSEFIASAHTVYTVRTRVLGESRTSFRKNDFSVLRRFNHFLWLFEQLNANNPGVIVPAPPEKVVLGRFSSEFVEQRRHALQSCLQRILNHPMLVSDPDLRLFLESDTFSVDIKHRRSESSGGLLSSLSSAVVSPKYAEADEYFTIRKQILDSLESQLQSLHKILNNAAKARTALAASTSELSAAIAAIANLSEALPKPTRDAFGALNALKKRAKELEEEQVASEEGEAGLIAVVDSYLRLCASVRLAMGSRLKVYANWQKAVASTQSIRASHDRARARGMAPFPEMIQDLTESERRADEAKRDFEDVSKLLKAEMVRFDTEKVDDFRTAVSRHVEGLVIRQKQIVASWLAYNDVVQRAIASNPEAGESVT